MFREFFILLLLGHVLGDFYFQTEKVAGKKEKSLTWVLIHGLIYWATMTLITVPIMTGKVILGVFAAAMMHLLIDGGKFIYVTYLCRRNGLKKHSSTKRTNSSLQACEITSVKSLQIFERNVFFIDLFLHMVCLIIIAYWMAASKIQINELQLCREFFEVTGLSEMFVISWILALLLIHKPANIAIQKLLMIYKPENKEEENKKDNNAGRLIGTLERIIMLIFLSISQYSAIGLVLTAKSIARYDRISKEKDFAEYYLLGTLISTVIVIVCSFLL